MQHDPRPADTGAARRRNLLTRIDFSSRLQRGIVVLVVIAVLELLVFGSYFSGRVAPPWDFFGAYNTEAYQWWELGGFFTPREWVSNAWAGYPSALNLQNSGWYLPVGLANAVAPFTLHASAVVSALHVGFGAVGTYLLVSGLRVRFPVALLATVASFFAVGHFSNAQHVDISRGYAWIPWLLIVFSPLFPWKRLWAVPVATLIIWQAATGMYPGMAIAFVYIGFVWLTVHQVMSRVRFSQFLLPLAIASVAALLLSMPRLLPYAMLQDNVAGTLPESSPVSLWMLGTVIFDYSSGDIGGDVSMRSFFIPSTIILLACFASWSDRVTKFAFALLIPAAVLGLPIWPWAELAQLLPGLSFSRFGLSDFKPFMILGIVLLACSGATRIVALASETRLPARLWASLGGSAVLLLGFAMLGLAGPFATAGRVTGFGLMLLGFGAIVLFLIPRVRQHMLAPRLLLGFLTILTVVVGSNWAYSNHLPWQTDRVAGEVAIFGEEVDSLIAQRVDDKPRTQRPARHPASADGAAGGPSQNYLNRNSYLNLDSLDSYLNLKGATTQALIKTTLFGTGSPREWAEFLAAPGTALTTQPGVSPSPEEFGSCANDAHCGPATFTPVSYTPGHFTYDVSSPAELTALFNEAHYAGWTAEVCAESGCEQLPTSRSSHGLVSVDIPEGEYRLHLDYVVRGAREAWVLFWAGVMLATSAAALGVARSWRKAADAHPR